MKINQEAYRVIKEKQFLIIFCILKMWTSKLSGKIPKVGYDSFLVRFTIYKCGRYFQNYGG